jgi:xanthine dehydrogenase accessory factor
MQSLHTWTFIYDNIKASIPVVMLYVLESKGSSPGRRGFFMAVNSVGEMEGSIGGGIMEYKFVEMAKARLAEGDVVDSVHKQIHDKSAAKDQSGMICSGEQTIFIYKLRQKDLKSITTIIETLTAGKTITLNLSDDGIDVAGNNGGADGLIIEEHRWKYTQVLGIREHVYIIGGGHCGLALSKLMKDLDFTVHIVDVRKDLNTIKKNVYTDEQIIVGDYSELTYMIPENESTYVVIMTFGYRTDDVVLRALYNKKFKYIGCLGSRRKIETMTNAYEAEGLNIEWFKDVHAPIGMQIKSQTPAEIAVSIAAEIIQIRNREKN